MTIKQTLTAIRATGATARWISETREYRVTLPNLPRDRQEAVAYYTDDSADAVATAVCMTAERGRI